MIEMTKSIEGGSSMRDTNRIPGFPGIGWQKAGKETIDKLNFINLIQDNKVSLYRLAKSILRNKQDIEDAISETILKAFENLNRLKSRDSFKPWIMRITANECYNILRKKKRIDLKEDMETLNLTYEDNSENELMWTIDRLEEDYRTVLVLFYYEDMSMKDISNVLNISLGTVKSRLSRAKAKLRNLLEDN